MEKFNPQPTLENELVIIRPLKKTDFKELFKIASNPEIWDQHPAKERSTLEGFKIWFQVAIDSGTTLVILEKKTNNIIGSSRYCYSEQTEDAIEIGYTFLDKKFWGKGYNKSFKELLMNHAFKNYNYLFFYVSEINFRSQKAVEKLGGIRINTFKGITLIPKPQASVIFCIDKNKFILKK